MSVGGLGIGPLIAGVLAQWVKRPLTLPYLVFVALGATALIGLATTPETGTPAPAASAAGQPSGSARAINVLVPGAAATLALSRFGRGHAAYGRAGLLGIGGIVAVGIVSIAVAYWKAKGYA